MISFVVGSLVSDVAGMVEEIATQRVTVGINMKEDYDKLKIEFIEYKIANDISRFFEDVRSEKSNEILGSKIREAIQGII